MTLSKGSQYHCADTKLQGAKRARPPPELEAVPDFFSQPSSSSFLNGRRLGSFGERWYFCRCLFYDRRFRYASIRLRSNLSPILVYLICETLRRPRLYRVHVSWRTHRGGVTRPPPEQLAGVVEEDPQDLQLVSWRSVGIHRRANLLPRRSRMAY